MPTHLRTYGRPTQRPAASRPDSSTGGALLLYRTSQGLNPGSGARKSRKLFGPEKPFVKLRPAYSVKLVCSYVV